MPELKEKYFVVLKSDISPLERESFSHFGIKITSKTGGFLLCFQCVDIDVSHHYFISLETFKSKDDEFTVPIRMPHHYISMILGNEDRPSIGFALE